MLDGAKTLLFEETQMVPLSSFEPRGEKRIGREMAMGISALKGKTLSHAELRLLLDSTQKLYFLPFLSQPQPTTSVSPFFRYLI